MMVISLDVRQDVGASGRQDWVLASRVPGAASARVESLRDLRERAIPFIVLAPHFGVSGSAPG
jgi:hypothetical protein